MAAKVDKTLPMREGEQALVDATNELIDEVAEQRTNNIAPFIANTASRSVAYSFAAGNAAACTSGNAVAIGNNAVASYTESAAIGSYAQTTRNNQVSVGRADKLRTISFVNSPIDNTDAATKQYVDTYQGTPADGSVSTAKIVDGAVTEAKLASESVSTGKIQSAAVTAVQLASGSVTTEKLASSAVTTDKVANKTINESKLTDALSVKLNQRKPIEVFTVPSTSVPAGGNADYTYTFNIAYNKLPVVIPIIYGAWMPLHITAIASGVTTTECTIKLINDSTTAQTVTSCFVAVIGRE